jgi:hypothetical protein
MREILERQKLFASTGSYNKISLAKFRFIRVFRAYARVYRWGTAMEDLTLGVITLTR